MSRTRSRRGISVYEVVITMGVMGVISALLAHSFAATTTLVDSQAAGVRLSTAQVAARQVATPNGYRYPVSVVAELRSPGLSFSELPSSSATAVSALRVDDQTLVLALRDGEGCTVLVDSVTRPPVWGRDPQRTTESCSATRGAELRSSISSPRQEDPTLIEMD